MVLLSVYSGASIGRLRVSSFFELWLVRLSAAKSWVLAEGFSRKARHGKWTLVMTPSWPFFRMFPLSLQTIITNQMRPRMLRGAWFSRLLQHPARRRSGFILSPGTHMGMIIDVLSRPRYVLSETKTSLWLQRRRDRCWDRLLAACKPGFSALNFYQQFLITRHIGSK